MARNRKGGGEGTGKLGSTRAVGESRNDTGAHFTLSYQNRETTAGRQSEIPKKFPRVKDVRTRYLYDMRYYWQVTRQKQTETKKELKNASSKT